MKLRQNVFSLITILLLLPFFLFSQSSIYQDAKELAAHLEENWTAHIELIPANSSQAKITVKRDKTELKPSQINKFEITDYGSYEIDVEPYSNLDTVLITFRDSVIYKSSADYHYSFGNYPNGKSVSMSQKIEDEPEKDLQMNVLETSLFLVDSLTGDTVGIEIKLDTVYSSFTTGSPLSRTEVILFEQEINAADKILFTLNAHADFKDVENTSKINFQRTQTTYSTNPFLNNLNIKSPLLAPNIDRYFSEDFFGKFNAAYSENYYQNYPWHKLLYGDSILNFQKTVSFKDASASYRKRIVTSQNELTDASIRINETNKRKNLLDAKTVAVGLSDFIAERAQEELNLTFFNRFKENLDKPSELTVLFPNTKSLLYTFEISNYKTLLSHARESFKVDLDNLGLNFPEVLKLKKYESLYNSPEVFNLSLIYSIADLAYKEEPVENILVAAFQKLRERKVELKKSINVELADNFIAAVTPKGMKKSLVNSKSIQRNGELQKLQKYVNEYLTAVENTYGRLQENNSSLYKMYLPTQQKMDRATYTEENSYERFNRETWAKQDKFRRSFFRPIQYNNRRVDENSILNFYKKTIASNLQGKEYYGYLLENPYPGDYQLFFKPQPDSINSILAEGIESSRNLLEENFETAFHDNYQLLQNAAQVYRDAIKTNILRREAADGPENKIYHFNFQAELLNEAIENEILFWENNTQLDKTDYHIAGLYFLQSLLENDEQIQLFINVVTDLDKIQDYNKLVATYYPQSLGQNYEQNMDLALNRLDSIQYDFEDKIATLQNEFAHLTLSDSLYQHQLLDYKFRLDTLSFNEDLVDETQEIKTMESMLKHAASFSPLHAEIDYSRITPDIAPIAKKLKQQKIQADELGQQLNTLNEKIRSTSDASVKESLSKMIDQINDERDGLEESVEETLMIELEKVEAAKAEKIKTFLPKKKELIERYRTQIDSLKTAVSAQLKPLKEVYSLQNNFSYKMYKDRKENVNEINFMEMSEMGEVNDFDATLIQTQTVFDTLADKRAQLENYFLRLDTSYCNDLVKAQSNAKNLAKTLEFSAHLLFAFRDYESNYDTVFVYDSSFIQVTINELDSLTGFINTLTRDSLLIKKKALDGTTDPLISARWITRKEFDELRRNPLEWNIFLGLLYQRLTSIEDAPNFSAEGVALLATKFLSITNDMETYRSELRRKKATNPELVTFKDYYPFIRSTVDLFNTVITTPSLSDTSATVARKFDLQNIPKISNDALSLYENIYVKEYGNAIINAMELLRTISNKKLSKKESRKSQRSINAVLTYGTFMANMINAQSSDQVKNILKSATLPPGSSRIKRETLSSFTINSYLGVAAGRDRLINVPSNINIEQNSFGASLSVPIGFTYSFSPNIIKNNSSFSIHVPLLDLGAITAYRQNPDNPNYTINSLPDFSWSNLFSPGAFVVYNFANSPFSLGVGGQYGPQLREIKINTGEAVNVNSWRFPMAFFTIDVPFFNLHTGARKIIVD